MCAVLEGVKIVLVKILDMFLVLKEVGVVDLGG